MTKLWLQLWQQHCEPIKNKMSSFPAATCKIYHCDYDKAEHSGSNMNHMQQIKWKLLLALVLEELSCGSCNNWPQSSVLCCGDGCAATLG